MRAQMSAREYARWVAFFSIEPMPALRADRRAAEIKQAVLAAAGMKHLPTITDLIPDWWDELHPQQTPEQIQRMMAGILARKKK